MMKILAAAAIVGFALQAQPAGAAPLHQPAGKWVVDYGDTSCTAARAYDGPAGPATFALRPSPNGSVVRLTIVRPGKVGIPRHFPVTTSITSAKTTGLRFSSSNKKSVVIWINVDRAALNGLAAAGQIRIAGKGIIDEQLALPDAAAVLKALDRCNDDLREHWNAGEAAKARFTRRAASLKPLAGYFSDDDYPEQALIESKSGATGVMMLIDEAGKLRDCMVEETSGIATLDAMACGVLLERAKFTPALDASGKPVRSVFATRIRWSLD